MKDIIEITTAIIGLIITILPYFKSKENEFTSLKDENSRILYFYRLPITLVIILLIINYIFSITSLGQNAFDTYSVVYILLVTFIYGVYLLNKKVLIRIYNTGGVYRILFIASFIVFSSIFIYESAIFKYKTIKLNIAVSSESGKDIKRDIEVFAEQFNLSRNNKFKVDLNVDFVEYNNLNIAFLREKKYHISMIDEIWLNDYKDYLYNSEIEDSLIFIEGILDHCKLKDTKYKGIPIISNLQLLFCNYNSKKLIAKFKQEILDNNKLLIRNDNPNNTFEVFIELYRFINNGLEIISEDGKIIFTRSSLVKTLDYMKELYKKNKKIDSDYIKDELRNSNSPYCAIGWPTWFMEAGDPLIANSNFSEFSNYPVSGVWFMSVLNFDENNLKEEANIFINSYIKNTKKLPETLLNNGVVPSVKVENYVLENIELWKKKYEVYLKLFKKSKQRPVIKNYLETEKNVGNIIINKLVNDDVHINEVINDLKEIVIVN